MKGLLLFIGESFRLGGQNTRNRGDRASYPGQINACKSHIRFIDYIKRKFNINIEVFISTYTTQYDRVLLRSYRPYLIGNKIHNDVIGLNNLFHDTIKNVDLDKYDFVFYIRIDLFLKQTFMEIVNPTINMILFPTICFIPQHKCGNDPRVNDTMIFIPKKYYKYISEIIVYHDAWHILVNNTDLNYDDLDTMIHTYHDSDSYKDLNPLYYIVNREQSNVFHSEGHVFDKNNF
jgi:hypothetical protein